MREVHSLYLLLIDEDDSSQDTAVDGLTHSQLVAESINVVESLKQQVCISMGKVVKVLLGIKFMFLFQLKHEQVRSSDLESTLLSKMEEHDQLDAQFQAEHEEEVKALRQQKQQLARQIEEIKTHYQQLVNEQDKQVHNVVILSQTLLY